MENFELLRLIFFVFLAGFIDSIAGGGGLIALPAYIATGIPIHSALGSNKFSSTFGTALSVGVFLKNKKVYLRPIVPSVVCALLGSALGARLALLTNDDVLRQLLIIAVPIVAIFVLIKKDFGEHNRTSELSGRTIMLGSGLASLLIGTYDGFFGPGTGSFLIFVFTFALKFDLVTASGNAKIINLASNIGSLVMFIITGQVLYAIAIPAAFAGVFGNFLGSNLAIKIGPKIIRPVFVLVLGILLFSIINN
ncbi:MAG: TSUP family transporter [Defluviitaleaceae bacterium]|nr:TSUP family transporter [Defluviitaleaceae bacterium]